MKPAALLRSIITVIIIIGLSLPCSSQKSALETPLSQDILTMLTNEISGQVIYNNEVLLAGAPWIRDRSELTDTFYESQKIYDLVKSYGIETTQFVRHTSDRQFDYPFWGEFRIVEPEDRIVARLDADAALIASGSRSADVTGELIYIPPLDKTEIAEMLRRGKQPQYDGKIALMWSHVRGETAMALDAAGVRGVISFNSRERYFDPNMVVYSRGSYGDGDNLLFGMSVSWRQWSELVEDIEHGQKLTAHCTTQIETFPDRFETVFSWIPGTEPDKKGVIFTAHLFEGYTKRGANDNMSGCVIQLEILRALTKLIGDGSLPQPRRNIYFLWPNEISGTYEFIKQNPGFPEKLSMNINMDMVGEGQRINNSWFTMSECPSHLPNYLDGLAASVMNYVWRTNDIVYLPDSPRGRSGGQYFPKPMMEKNGSIDAFRFYIHAATGGSDHICFNDPSVGVPGIEFFTWPDYWYHADTDTPDKSDQTEMKRVAFIGAACAYAAAYCSDDVLPGLIDAASEFGYSRVAEREQAKALRLIETANTETLNQNTALAYTMVNFAAEREIGAVESIREVYTNSPAAQTKVANRVRQWELYKESLGELVLEYAKIKGKEIGAKAPGKPKMTSAERRNDKIVPSLHPDVKGTQFRLIRSEGLMEYLRANPEKLPELGLSIMHANTILNYVNGSRSITKIRDCTAAETMRSIPVESVAGFLDILKSLNIVEY